MFFSAKLKCPKVLYVILEKFEGIQLKDKIGIPAL